MNATSSPELSGPAERRADASIALLHNPNAVVMIRPHHFTPNPQTAADNSYQVDPADLAGSTKAIAQTARREVTSAARALRRAGATVHLFEDRTTTRPDAVFPNNWFTTHPDGTLALYPIHSPNRRLERRFDILRLLHDHYQVVRHADFSPAERDGVYLEGSGAMVFDRAERTAYVAISHRADPSYARTVCPDLGYEAILFDATDSSGVPIYHTNVMMTIGTRFAAICLEAIPDTRQRALIEQRLRDTGRELIALSRRQIAEFAGNALEIDGRHGPLLAISERGWTALTGPQQTVLQALVRPVTLAVPTLELAGGSVRCMLAGIHLLQRR